MLGGSLREIKESYGRNLIALRATGGEAVLADQKLVARVVSHADESEVEMAEGVDSQQLLNALLLAGATVTKFEVKEPSLNDIFIDLVGGSIKSDVRNEM